MVTTTFGNKYTEITEYIIQQCITNTKEVFVEIFREPTYEESDIDDFPVIKNDFTIEEIINGTNYLLTLDIPTKTLREYLDFVDSVYFNIDLKEQRNKLLKKEITKEFENKVIEFNNTTIMEVLLYDIQEREAKAFKDSNYQNTSLCPLISNIAKVRGIDLVELSNKILLKSKMYKEKMGELLGEKQKREKEINK